MKDHSHRQVMKFHSAARSPTNSPLRPEFGAGADRYRQMQGGAGGGGGGGGRGSWVGGSRLDGVAICIGTHTNLKRRFVNSLELN